MRFANFTADEIVAGLIGLGTGVVVLALVYRFVRSNPWPRPFRIRFVFVHVIAGLGFALLWHALSGTLRGLLTESSVVAEVTGRLDEALFIGFFMYLLATGIAYAFEESARAARAEALSASTQLAALRSQLHPHFLFNALHTVVQLIPVEPRRAMEAAEIVADLLRTNLEEKRDEVTLGEELRFVSRYLAMERIRFGERLIVREEIPDELRGERIPAFAVQTLVENAVRHGAAPSVAPTEIVVTASGDGSRIELSVTNSGEPTAIAGSTGSGTGLARLSERVRVLYGSAGKLEYGPRATGGFSAALTIPRLNRGKV